MAGSVQQPTGSAGAGSAGTAALANTGNSSAVTLLVGLALLLGGIVLLGAQRRTRG
ncbi:MAG: LPXTG cell wall anchor domain-containing protein [Microthrixaceae bacterium]